MKMPQMLWWAVLAGASMAAQAVEFPLEVKEMSLQEALACPGGYGQTAMFMTGQKAASLRKVPKAVSQYPLVAEAQRRVVRNGKPTVEPGLLLSFDESQGTGRGYDRMILDLNHNGDLTDDPVFERLERQQINTDGEIVSFGPVPLLAGDQVGQWRPRLYVQMYVYERPGSKTRDAAYIGYARIFAGNRLETTVDVNGIKQKFGVVDGNCNLRMGEPCTLQKYRRLIEGKETDTYYLDAGDYFLRDQGGSGKFERRVADHDAEPFSSLIYFGAKPYSAELTDDLKVIRFEPFSGAVGELRVKPEVIGLTLAWEQNKDQWIGFTPGVKEGKAVVPVGAYRVANCTVGAKTPSGEWIRTATTDIKKDILKVSASQAARLEYGNPLKMELTATKNLSGSASDSGMMGAVRGLFGSLAGTQSTLAMNVVIAGATGERYSGFYKTGAGAATLDPPRFEVLDSAGQRLDSGNFAFG